MCPHSYFAYARSGYGKERKWVYLGGCNQMGLPREKYSTQLAML